MEKPPFDELRQLAEQQPEAFEALRAELVEDFIRRIPQARQRRLRGLQFVIDARRSMAGNPVKALVEIQAMMHASLARLDSTLRFRCGPAGPCDAEQHPRPAKVISLFPATHHSQPAESGS